MEKEFVPYQPSLDMKELGFDEPCFGYYGKNNVFMFFVDVTSCITNSEFELYPTAPTFSQAFRWFRENYGVHMYPTKYDETKWWIAWGTWTSEVFNSFEEAELECLKKLIEIVKENEL